MKKKKLVRLFAFTLSFAVTVCSTTLPSFAAEVGNDPEMATEQAALPEPVLEEPTPLESISNIPLEKIYVDPELFDLDEGQTQQLRVVYTPTDTTDDKTVVWYSDDPSVAEVDQNGLVTGIKEGVALIYAKVGEKLESSGVTVHAASRPLRGITLNDSNVTLRMDQEQTLYLNLIPKDTTDQVDVSTAVWTSSDETVVTVEGGRLQPVSMGTATITAELNGKIATGTVTITKEADPEPEKPDIVYEDNLYLTNSEEPEAGQVKIPIYGTVGWNYAEQLMNGLSRIRAENGAGAVKLHPVMMQTAMIRAAELDVDYTHYRPSGRTTPGAENIALFNLDDPDHDPVEKVLNLWLNSPGHAKIMLDKRYNQIGVGFFINPVTNIMGVALIMGYGDDETTTLSSNNTTQSINLIVKPDKYPLRWEDWKTESEIPAGQSIDLKVQIGGAYVTAEQGTIKSSDESIAKVTLSEDHKVVVEAVGTPGQTCDIIYQYPGMNDLVRKIKIKSIPLQSIALNKKSTTIEEGKKDTLTLTYNPVDTTDSKSAAWSTSNDKIATVKDGVVTAISSGTATITVKVGDKTDQCIVTVIKKQYPLQSISLDKAKTSLTVGEKDTLKVSYNPTNTTDSKTITWSSSNNKIASVKDGVVTAVATGSATITAKVGSKTATCVVTVKAKQYPLQNISLNKTKMSLTVGEKDTLKVSYNPTNTTDSKAVAWSSTNNKIASVKDGVVTAVAAGSATITAKVGNKTAACAITVKAKQYPLQSISLSKSKVSLTVGGKDTLKVTYNPSNTTDSKAITWSSSNNKIVSVKDGVVTAVSAGSATITAKVGNKTATCAITVKAKQYPLQSISLSKSKVSLTVGGKDTLKVTYNPSNTTDSKVVTWSSTNNKIASVKDGVVTAVAAGSVTITAKVGSKTATCAVTVVQKAPDFSGVKISGKYQGWTDDGVGWLMGISTNKNPQQKLKYEMLVMDFNKWASGDPAPWIYTTGKQSVSSGSTLWTKYYPPYNGIFWTYFRVYDDRGNIIADQCYQSSYSKPVRITGKYQGPNPYGKGWLLGISTNVNQGNNLRYEMLVMDFYKWASGDPNPWIYTTGLQKIKGTTMWTTFMPPRNGYYWTYFRIYDMQGNIVDDKCYETLW